MRYYLAIDIGASSGRHILGHMEDGKLFLEEVYRFDNLAVTHGGQLCWDTKEQFSHILTGIKKCGDLGKIPVSVGIDTWGVDFALLDKDDQIIGDTVAYRDRRTEGMDRELDRYISEDDLYRRTGIQKQPFNTIYQFLALKTQNPELLDRAESFLFLPEFFHFLLTGVKKTEYSIASTSGLLEAREKTWDWELIRKLGFPERIFSKTICPPGTRVGGFSPAVEEAVGFQSTVVLPACHDTGSAFLAVPAKDENAVYISSGTWSLLGVENSEPITTPESRAANFTNEGGYGYQYRYLQNIMGLWMIQSIRRDLNKEYSFAQMEQMAREVGDFPSRVDVNDGSFFAPDNMMDAVKNYCQKTGQQIPGTVGEIVQCVYMSLAVCYGESVKNLEKITGKKASAVNIVGGGTKDSYLNTLTAKVTGLPVYAGPAEGTALGNILAQMLTDGIFADVDEVRTCVRKSFEIKEYVGTEQQ